MAEGVKHDYHLVDPSPWPIVGSLAAFVLAVGAVWWMNWSHADFQNLLGPLVGLSDATPAEQRAEMMERIASLSRGLAIAVFVIGALLIVYTMAGWWMDVVKESVQDGAHTPVVKLGLRYGMILFIASEVMFFAAWFWAYFNVALFPADFGLGSWPPDGIVTFDPWHLPLINTIVLLTSGTTVTWAHHAVQTGDRQGAIWMLALTVVLGVLFTLLQIYEYTHAGFTFGINEALRDPETGLEVTAIYGSTFYMATGFHGAHVVIGTIFLAVCLARAIAGHFTPERHFGFEAAAWYWHFVDVVWLFLFAAIYVWGAGPHH